MGLALPALHELIVTRKGLHPFCQVRFGDARATDPRLKIRADAFKILHRQQFPATSKIRLNVLGDRTIVEFCGTTFIRRGKFIIATDEMLDISACVLIRADRSTRGQDLNRPLR